MELNQSLTTGADCGKKVVLVTVNRANSSKGTRVEGKLKAGKSRLNLDGHKNESLGLQKEGLGSGIKSGGTGFKVGSSRKIKERVIGLRDLDPKNYSVVVLDENCDPNLLVSKEESARTTLGFKNLINLNLLPSALKKQLV